MRCFCGVVCHIPDRSIESPPPPSLPAPFVRIFSPLVNNAYVWFQGYCLVEFEKREEAELAIAEMDGSQLLEQDISVSWAFVRGASNRCALFFGVVIDGVERKTKKRRRRRRRRGVCFLFLFLCHAVGPTPLPCASDSGFVVFLALPRNTMCR